MYGGPDHDFRQVPVLHYTVPTEVKNALLSGAAGLSEADQQEFTEAACKAVNGWATTHGPAVAKDLDARYLNAAGPMCNKFTVASVAVAKKYVPNLPAATWRLEPVAKKVWQNAMQKLSVESPDPTCRQAYTNAKAGW